MALCRSICIPSVAISSQMSVVAGALSGYAASFAIVFVWTRRLHRRYGTAATPRRVDGWRQPYRASHAGVCAARPGRPRFRDCAAAPCLRAVFTVAYRAHAIFTPWESISGTVPAVNSNWRRYADS